MKEIALRRAIRRDEAPSATSHPYPRRIISARLTAVFSGGKKSGRRKQHAGVFPDCRRQDRRARMFASTRELLSLPLAPNKQRLLALQGDRLFAAHPPAVQDWCEELQSHEKAARTSFRPPVHHSSPRHIPELRASPPRPFL